MKILPDFREEKKLWRQGYQLVIGVDEVGRGAFAGPVVVGAVAFPMCHPESEGRRISEILRVAQNDNGIKIDDSKRLKPEERKKAAGWIKENCLTYGIGEVGVRTINRLGIGKATARAMRRAIKNLKLKIKNYRREEAFLLVDGFHVQYISGIGLKNQKAIKKGDQKSISIAAASILAKVYRDTLMQKFAKRYKEYQWGINKGYGTKKHQTAIFEGGLTTLHRRQFVETFLKHYQASITL